ncbi:hypothetical protein ABEF92_003970 [Exophiala dermatitidis]|uniref:Uncharacterized protein n=1 Tax=Exophiala dermatitidis (strain ATCC 34100 / CBS 525.76 / NIH/UT8656) TaxID=858893 RepID=H6BRC8_EXODN|nr:uncharacterized protein HMPREF1120_02874 [Exophiala dermatitidis NIH/UT8656]EHY54709.1 hypothetical protein HMPREF1120_02874 [Exophiala dermatitidis NIH/UT8656]
MAPLPVKTLQRRGNNAGRTFTIVFAIIALLVVLACLIWGIILPRYRKRDVGLPTNRFVSQPRIIPQTQRFPSHPALLRGFRKKPSTVLRKCNPRTESSKNPAQVNASHHPFSDASHHAASVLGAPVNSNGLFTPVKDRLPLRRGRAWARGRAFRWEKRTEAREDVTIDSVNGPQEYVIRMPEALVLKPRPAGRPPPLTRQLERFPCPQSDPSGKGGLMHPVKLFQELQLRDSQSTMDISGTPCPPRSYRSHSNMNRFASNLPVATQDRCITTDPADNALPHTHPEPEEILSIGCGSHTGSAPETNMSVPDVDTPVKQRRAEDTEFGTRHATSEVEIRDWLDHANIDGRTDTVSSRRGYTPTTDPFTTPGVSTTAPTSPAISANTVPALSTPSQHPGPSCNDALTLPHVRFHRRTPSSGARPLGRVMRPMPRAVTSELGHCTCRDVYGHCKPAQCPANGRCRLSRTLYLQKRRISRNRHSFSSLTSVSKPSIVPAGRRSILRSSSVYSQDIRGLRVSTNPEFARIAARAVEMQAQAALSTAVQRNDFPQEDKLMDLPECKMDSWIPHIAGVQKYVSPCEVPKRSQSEAGPRRLRLDDPQTMISGHGARQRDGNGEDRCISTTRPGGTADNVYDDGTGRVYWARALQAAQTVRRYRPEPAVVGTPPQGTAPGGGQWI